jgi:hypothetical protein
LEESVEIPLADEPQRDQPYTHTLLTKPTDPDEAQRPDVPTLTDPVAPRQSGRNAPHQPGHYETLHNVGHTNLVKETMYECAYASALETGPLLLKEALAGLNAIQWKEALDAEIKQLQDRKTWELIPHPKDKPVIPSQVILQEKPGPNGEVIKQKVRVVAGGHKQQKGINYNETFVAVAKIASIRAVLSLATQWDWEVDQVDVVGAYLNCILKEEVYMELPHQENTTWYAGS